ARVFNALYHAGGPSEIGTFREIIVRRDGREVARVDLYPYLLEGDASADIRLEQGDIVFVPTVGPQVRIAGEVRRPGIYELRPGEGLRDALAFAGGLQPNAYLGQVQVDRILAPSERAPGRDRTVVDVSIEELAMEGPAIPLRGGDSITVFAVDEERRNRVAVTGGVRRPGAYQWTPGMTLRDLVLEASGLDEGAYTERALIYRLQEDRTRRLLRASLEGEGAELRLADRDSVVVLESDSLRLPMTVEVAGYVKAPGQYPLAEGMSVRDLILAAGGFAEGANIQSAEVARPVPTADRTDRTAEVVTVQLADPLAARSRDSSWARDGIPAWSPEAGEFELARGDRVYVRRAPGFDDPRSVVVTGEVMMPGPYELGSRNTRISDIIRRAGGVTPEAYHNGFTIIRDGRPIAGNLTGALVDPTSEGNILLEPGDSLHVPLFDGTVQVSGAVLLEARVLYERGRSLMDYIDRAGGFAEEANRDQVVVTYASGERAVMDKVLMFRRDPVVEPGSRIYVPTLPPSEREGTDWGQIITRSTAVLSAL
ncbi:MAG TPA: SLBB domain-containing protein, partial [Longimicrobiales bacterium]|nr:SLBB domain-containing protein [Longimicrobiales bacterium]